MSIAHAALETVCVDFPACEGGFLAAAPTTAKAWQASRDKLSLFFRPVASGYAPRKRLHAPDESGQAVGLTRASRKNPLFSASEN
ncbi:MAG: hypothetical protein MUD08_02065 [Cytophagales bacterium]|nr:hypothetical protein [Cytophagales bacterium]